MMAGVRKSGDFVRVASTDGSIKIYRESSLIVTIKYGRYTFEEDVSLNELINILVLTKYSTET